MFVIEIACISWFFCHADIPFNGARYNTLPECERVLRVVYRGWKPANGSYVFNCRRAV